MLACKNNLEYNYFLIVLIEWPIVAIVCIHPRYGATSNVLYLYPLCLCRTGVGRATRSLSRSYSLVLKSSSVEFSAFSSSRKLSRVILLVLLLHGIDTTFISSLKGLNRWVAILISGIVNLVYILASRFLLCFSVCLVQLVRLIGLNFNYVESSEKCAIEIMNCIL